MAISDYGPSRLENEKEYDAFVIPPYLRGQAKKMQSDLRRLLKLYVGKDVTIYQVDKAGERCTVCTDIFTGAKVLSNCDICGGTGYLAKYNNLGTFKGLPNFNARVKDTSELGNQDKLSSRRDTLTLVDAPLLNDTDLLRFDTIETIYKIVDMEPSICGMAGVIITQTIQIARLPLGSREYAEGLLI